MWSVISTRMLLITPTLPLSAPFKARLEKCLLGSFQGQTCESYLKMNPEKVFDSAKQYMESERPNRPVRMTGFRPIRSESPPQCMTVHAWVA